MALPLQALLQANQATVSMRSCSAVPRDGMTAWRRSSTSADSFRLFEKGVRHMLGNKHADSCLEMPMAKIHLSKSPPIHVALLVD